MYLLIDIGNTSTKVGAYRPDVDGYDVVTMPTYSGDEEELVNGFIGAASFDRCIVSSVVPSELERYRQLLRARDLDPVVVSSDLELPFTMGYRTPATLGADRIAGAVGAWSHVGAEADDAVNIVSVDAGTAVTFDIITTGNVFVGGPIAAGPELLRKALAGDTAQLPDVQLFMPGDVVSGSTEDAVRAGIMVAFAEGCLGILRRITEQLESETRIVFSGGWGRLLADEYSPTADYHPTVMLDGMVKLLEMNG